MATQFRTWCGPVLIHTREYIWYVWTPLVQNTQPHTFVETDSWFWQSREYLATSGQSAKVRSDWQPFRAGILGNLDPEVRLTDGNRKILKPKHAAGHVCHYFWTVNPSFQCFMRIHCTYTISFKVDFTCTWCINMLPLFLSVYYVGLFCIYDSPQVEFPPPDFAMLIMSLKQEQFRRNIQIQTTTGITTCNIWRKPILVWTWSGQRQKLGTPAAGRLDQEV